jgi:uncharacterized protein
MPPTKPQDDARLEEGIRIFNEGHHWHAHEAWEALWLELEGDDKTFLQGLIMAAALLVHYDRKNPAGVAKHWRNVQERLTPHAPLHWRIDVEGLLEQLKTYVAASVLGPAAMTLESSAVQIRRKSKAT